MERKRDAHEMMREIEIVENSKCVGKGKTFRGFKIKLTRKTKNNKTKFEKVKGDQKLLQDGRREINKGREGSSHLV